MSTDAKTLARGEIRFVVKKIDKAYRVYDKHGGSFPYRTHELGRVVQDVPEDQAQAEADRLNEQFVGAAPAPRRKTIQPDHSAGDQLPSPVGRKARVKKTPLAAPVETIELFKEAEFDAEAAEKLPDYGDLSDETEGHIDWKTA